MEADFLTLSQHPDGPTLPQPAVLALPPHVHVHLTAAAALTVIHGLFSHAAPEETCRETNTHTFSYCKPLTGRLKIFNVS